MELKDYKYLDIIGKEELHQAIIDKYYASEDLLVKSDLSSDEFLLNEFLSYLSSTIWTFYCDSRIAYENDDTFFRKLTDDIMFSFNYLYKKYLNLNDLYDEVTSLNKLSKTTITSKGSAINLGGNTTRQASTPTIIQGEVDNSITIETPNPTLDDETTKEGELRQGGYTDKYTNYQGTSRSIAEGKDIRETITERDGSTRELLDNIDRLTRSLSSEIIRLLSKHFIWLL